MDFYSIISFSFLLWFIIIVLFSYSNFSIYIKNISLVFSFFQFFIIVTFWVITDEFVINLTNSTYLFYFIFRWVQGMNLYFIFGVDNISFFFLILSLFLCPVCVLISWNTIKYKLNSFLVCLLSIFFILFNLFCCIDLLFFYICFESILIPMFILIGVWGSRQRKIHAVYQFFFYTLVSSLFMLLGLVIVYSHIQSMDLRILYTTNFSFYRQMVLWFSFFIAFAVKVPLFPFHIRLPEAHVEAPTIGSVILAGVLLKMGTYGLLRFVLIVFCDATYYFTPFVYTLCILGILYTCCSTIVQIDLKKIIAYSSVSHMSFVILGLFSSNLYGIIGSIFLMLSHGIVSSGLFFSIGCIYDRYKTRVLRYYSGLALTMPLFSLTLFALVLSNISFPGTSSFIGELLILIGLFENNYLAAILSTFSIILTATYSIWLYNRIIFNELNISLRNFSDLSKKEFLISMLFCLITIYYGIRPGSVISLLEGGVYNLLMFK